MIYIQLRLLENQYCSSIRAWYNTGGTSAYHFYLIPIRDEVEWRMLFQMEIIEINWRMIELYVKSSIDNVGDSLNNLPKISNRTENTISFTINLAHQIYDEREQNKREQNDCDEVMMFVMKIMMR
jgi:hypothetical protein